MEIERHGYEKLKLSHSLSFPMNGVSFGELVGIDYFVVFERRMPVLIVKAREVVLPGRDDDPVLVRVDKVRQFGSKFESFLGHFEEYRNYGRPRTMYFEEDVFSSLTEEYPLCSRLADHEALSMKEAVRRLAFSYNLDPAQVTVTINEYGRNE